MSWLEKFRITHKQMAIILTVLALLPIILSLVGRPIILPLTIGPRTKDFYDRVQELPEGSIVAFADHRDFPGYMGKRDMYRAVIYHIFDRKLKFIMCSFWHDVPQAFVDLIAYSGVEKKYGVKEGVDYVIFPYLAGEETALAAAAADFHKAYATDIRGVPVKDIPLMQGVHSLKDVQLVISDASSFTFIDMFVRQWPAAYGVKAVDIWTFANVAPYYGRFVFGALDGPRGYAEYESLTGYVGEELLRMDARNLQGLMVFAALFLGNLSYFYIRSRQKAIAMEKPR